MYKLCLLSALLMVSSCSIFRGAEKIPAFATNPVVAHRGAFRKNNFPENSIASLREAIRLKCSGSEFDVRMTADDSLIVMHDPHYHGLAIEKSSLLQLRSFGLSNGETVPTLRQYLLAGLQDNRSTKLVLEIKPSAAGLHRSLRITELVLQLVEEMQAGDYLSYISFDYEVLRAIALKMPAALTQYLSGDKTPEQLKADGIRGADYPLSVYRKNPEWIQRAKQLGIFLNAWTVNEKADMEWLIEKGFDFITTNEPEALLALWKHSENR